MSILDVLAILSTGLILFVYIFYPIVLYLIKNTFRPACKNKTTKFSPYVSILVPTYNEEAVIESKIRNLLRLDYPKKMYEILIVDSGSQDGTLAIAGKYANDGVTVLKQEKRRGKASAINFGLEVAKGEIIVITDANAEFEPTALSGLIDTFNDNVGAALPRLTPSGKLGLWDRLFYKMHHVYKRLESEVDSVFIVFGELFAFRRALIDKIDENVASDDLEIAFNVRRKGKKIKYVPNVEVIEKIPSSNKETRVQRTRRAFGIIQVMNKNRNILFNSKFGFYGSVIFPVHFVQLTILPFLIFFLLGFYLFLILSFITGLIYAEPLWFAVLLILFSASLLLAKIRQIFLIGFNFMLTQFHIILALIDVFRGKSYRLWEKASSTRD